MMIGKAAALRRLRKGGLASWRAFLLRVQRVTFAREVLDRMGHRQRTFDRVYRTGAWTKRQLESRSGLGSTLEATEPLRHALPSLLRALEVRTLLDVPCGDWNWMSHVELPVERYVGGDLVAAIVSANQRSYGDERHRFEVVDLCTGPLPAADLLICRDAMIHFSLADVQRTLDTIARSDVTYLAATTFTATTTNVDIPTGAGWRHLNLQAPPFSLPPPLATVPDDVFHRPDKVLAVWRVTDLPATRGSTGSPAREVRSSARQVPQGRPVE